MQIKSEHLEQLELEIQHIFDSGANEVRVYEMIQTFIERRGKALFIPNVVGNEVKFESGFTYDFESKQQAQSLRSQLRMTSARNYILQHTEDFEDKLQEFIDNYR